MLLGTGPYLLVVSCLIFVKGEIEDCKAVTINPEVNSILRVGYSRKNVINKKLKIVTNNGKTFGDILTASCPKFPKLFLEYREQDSENAPWTSVQVFKNAPRKKALTKSMRMGEVQLPKGLEIEFCKAYDMRFVLNSEQSSVFQFGPYYNIYTEEEINELPFLEEQILNITYAEENTTVTATWDFICGKSMKVFLKEGDNNYENIGNVSNIVASEFSNSITFTAKPCTQYKIQIESFWTDRPIGDDGTLYDASNIPYTSSPDYQTFGNIQMDTVTKQLSWDFSEYKGTYCGENIEYKITLEDLDGEELFTLRESKDPKISGMEILDLIQEIGKKKVDLSLEKCHSYQLKMNISSTTGAERIFKHVMITNQEGEFNDKEEDEPEVIINDDEIIAKIGSCIANTKLVVRDLGNGKPERSGNSVQIEDVKASNKTFNLSDFKKLKPCVSYSVHLVSEDELEQLNANTKFEVSRNAEKLPRKDPAGTPTLQLINNALKIVDDKQNERCEAAKYVVKCWVEGTNETDAAESKHDSANIPLDKIVGLTSDSQYICQSRIEYGEMDSQSGTFSPWTGELSVPFSGVSIKTGSGSPTVKSAFILVTLLLNLVLLL